VGSFKCTSSGGRHLVEGTDAVQMVMLVRRTKEYFTDFIAREAKARGLKVVVNGSYIDLSWGAKMAVMTSGAALDSAESIPAVAVGFK